MIRSLVVAAIIAAAAPSCLCGAVTAGATPSDDTGQCTFGITPPTVVPVSGVSYVYASMRPGSCTLTAHPYQSTVCLAIEGDGSAGECASRPGTETAELWIAYRHGATYIEKGKGCAGITTPPYNLCEDFPASRYTL